MAQVIAYLSNATLITQTNIYPTSGSISDVTGEPNGAVLTYPSGAANSHVLKFSVENFAANIPKGSTIDSVKLRLVSTNTASSAGAYTVQTRNTSQGNVLQEIAIFSPNVDYPLSTVYANAGGAYTVDDLNNFYVHFSGPTSASSSNNIYPAIDAVRLIVDYTPGPSGPAVKRWDGTGWVSTSFARRWTGSVWADAKIVRH